MLVDLKLPHDPILAAITKMNGQDETDICLQQGVYQIGHFGGSHWPGAGWTSYPDVTHPDHPPKDWDDERNAYGVCDSMENMLEKLPILQHPVREFIVTLTPIHRDVTHKGRGGGWRWHKWGPYIGSQVPTAEYIDDEPLIELVYVYHVYEKDGPATPKRDW